MTLLSDHRLFVEKISSGEYAHGQEILVWLANCLSQESDLFEEVFLTYDGEIGLCCLGANYQLEVFSRVLFLVICLCLGPLETSQSWVVNVGELLVCRILHHPSSSLHHLLCKKYHPSVMKTHELQDIVS